MFELARQFAQALKDGRYFDAVEYAADLAKEIARIVQAFKAKSQNAVMAESNAKEIDQTIEILEDARANLEMTEEDPEKVPKGNLITLPSRLLLLVKALVTLLEWLKTDKQE